MVNRARDQDDPSTRYTEGGINVVALDRKGRGLHRARPERRPGSGGFTPIEPTSNRALPIGVLALVLVLVALGVAVGWWWTA